MIEKIQGLNLLKQYGRKTALSCSLEIHGKGIFSIIGPNGSGKSTLLRILSLLEKPDDGEVVISYQTESLVNPFNNLSLRRKIVLVPSHSKLFSDSVFNNVSYGLKLRKEKRVVLQEKVRATITAVGLEDKIETMASALSSGEQQRVALARALVLEPDVLFLDEPTASLDPENTKLIENQVKDWNKNNRKTIVMVTHNLFQAKALSDFVIFMYEGKIVESCQTQDFFQNPQTEMGRKFIMGEIY